MSILAEPDNGTLRGVPIVYRLAVMDDAEAIREIYNREVVGSTATFDLVPRSLEDQQVWIDEHSGAHPAIVAVEANHVAGFGSLTPYRSRPAYRTTVENSIYVDQAHQGRGIGRGLLEELIRLAGLHGFHAVMARIVGSIGGRLA